MRFCGFNSRSPSGERRRQTTKAHPTQRSFNSRSPSGERLGSSPQRFLKLLFQLTLPERGATRIYSPADDKQGDSTHAPRAGSDTRKSPLPTSKASFNTRSPCGERRPFAPWYDTIRFVSTHAPRAGSDLLRKGTFIYRYFKGHFANRNSGKLFAPVNKGLCTYNRYWVYSANLSPIQCTHQVRK